MMPNSFGVQDPSSSPTAAPNFMNLLSALVYGGAAPGAGGTGTVAPPPTDLTGGVSARQLSRLGQIGTTVRNAMDNANGMPGMISGQYNPNGGYDPAVGTPDPQPDLQAVLDSLSGPAPSLSDYYDATPYQQALASLNQGQTTGQGTIDQAYSKALSDFGALQQQASGQQTSDRQQYDTDMMNAQNQQNQMLGNTNAMAGGAGGGLAQQLAVMQAQSAAQRSSGAGVMDQIKSLENSNLSSAKAGIAPQHQQATDALTGAITTARNSVNSQMAAAASKGQQALASAQQRRAVQQQNLLATARRQAASAVPDSPSPRDQVAASISQMAGSADPSAQQMLSAFNTIVNGDGTLDPKSGKAASNVGEAVQRLNAALPAAMKAGMTQQEAQSLQSMIQGWYNTSKPAKSAPKNSEVAAALQAMSGLGLGV